MHTATTALNFRVLPSRRGETCTSRHHFDRNDCWSRGASTPYREAQGGPGRMVHPRRPRAPLKSQHVRRLHVGPAHALQVRRSQGQLKVAKCERTRAFSPIDGSNKVHPRGSQTQHPRGLVGLRTCFALGHGGTSGNLPAPTARRFPRKMWGLVTV